MFECVFCFLLGSAVALVSVYCGMRIRKETPPSPVSEEESRQEEKISKQWEEFLSYDGKESR